MKPRIHIHHYCLSFLLLVFLISSLLMVGCGGGRESGAYRTIPMDTQEPGPTTSQDSEDDILSATQPVTVDVEPEPPFRQGWIFTKADKESVERINQISQFNINHIQLGGDIYSYIDDLIFEGEQKFQVKTLIRQLKKTQAEIYLWSRELNIDSSMFRFHPSDPKLIARKSAYRMALEAFPQVDGIVLTFEGAKVAPWEAERPGFQSIDQDAKIEFVIQSVKDVVVDELGKDLWVRLAVNPPPVESDIISAARSFPGDEIGWIIPFDKTEEWRSFMNGRRVMVEMTTESLTSRIASDEWEKLARLRDSDVIDGISLFVQSSSERPGDSIQAFDIYVFSQWMNDSGKSRDELLQQWISDQYGWLPTSWEGYSLQRILEALQETEREMTLVKGIYDFSVRGEIPANPLASNPVEDQFGKNPRFEIIEDELKDPNKQTLIDLAQEGFEVIEDLNQAIHLLERLKENLREGDYEELRTRLNHQRKLARVYQYAKQCYWGFQFWNKTWNEQEALHLEAHLQRLEQQASEWEQESESNTYPADPQRIGSFVDSIRAEFPKVLLGAKERDWNHIREIMINQTGPNSMEVKWKTDQPSTSRVFVGEQMPIFSRFEKALEFPDTEHQCVIRNLKPDTRYCFKIQTITEDGQVTNSGFFFFELMTAEV